MTLDVVAHRAHGLDRSAFARARRAREPTSGRPSSGSRAAAGIPSPRLGGAWNKTSPAIKRSYFFLTDFRESQFDEALAIARRGGFAMILLGQESWCAGTGHYEIDRDRFPDGLDGLKRTIGRFHDAGFGVGLHFLGASIYPPDPYITPVPDPPAGDRGRHDAGRRHRREGRVLSPRPTPRRRSRPTTAATRGRAPCSASATS